MQTRERNKYLLKNTVIFAIGNFGTKLIAFFLVPLYTNILTTNDYGTVDLIYNIGMVLVPILTLNIAEAVLRFPLDKEANQEKIMSTGLVLLFFSILGGLLIIPIASISGEIREYAIYIFLYTVTAASSQIFLCYLKGKELLIYYSLGNIIQTLCVAVFNILFLVVWQKGIAGYLLAYILANVVTAIYACITGNILKVLRRFQIDIALSKQMIKYSVVLIPNSFMWWIMNSADRIMVTMLVGAGANGVYAVAYKVPTLLSTFTSIFNQAWSFTAVKENESEDREEYSNLVFEQLVSIVIVVAIGVLMITKIFLKYYVAQDYFEAWHYVPYLMVGFVFMTLGTFLSSCYTVHKDSWGFLISGTIGAVVNVILNFTMIPSLGAVGAAIATCIAYITVFVYRVFDTKKYLGLKVFKRKYVIGYALLAVAAMTIYIDNIYGQALLILEFMVALLIYRKIVLTVIKGVCTRIRKRQ